MDTELDEFNEQRDYRKSLSINKDEFSATTGFRQE
jgi:hypothetical protein